MAVLLCTAAAADVIANSVLFTVKAEEPDTFDINESVCDLLILSFLRLGICGGLVAYTYYDPEKVVLTRLVGILLLCASLIFVMVKSAFSTFEPSDPIRLGMIATTYSCNLMELCSTASLEPLPVYCWPFCWAHKGRRRRLSTNGGIQEELLKIEEVAPDQGKFGFTHLRFTILYALIILILGTLPIWLSFIIPGYIIYVDALVISFFSLLWVVIAFNAVWNFSKMMSVPVVTLDSLKTSRKRQFKHIVIVPCYLDPIEILFDCIGSLAMQGDKCKDLVVVVTFEARTPDVDRKIACIRKSFSNFFGDLLIVRHTLEPSTEIPGGCSNKNFALRAAHAFIKKKAYDKSSSVTITTCDTDSLFYPEYFKTLETCYNNVNPRINEMPKMCVWQPPLFYNWNLDERPFFNRITGIMRSMMMLGGLISLNLNPMSIFSYPIELGAKAGFINPRYGVDDIIAKVRWMCATDEKVPVVLLPVPVISGPTIGTTWFEEWNEWARQIRRWIVGSSESFHYFIIHFKGQPLISGISWFILFFLYYGVMLCCGGVFQLLSAIPLPYATYPSLSYHADGHETRIPLRYAGLIGLGIQYCTFGVAFIIDRMAIDMMHVREEMSVFRNILHWLVSPFVLLTYSLVAFVSILKFVFVGKKMAGHDMAAKEGLQTAGDTKMSNAVEQALLQNMGGTLEDEKHNEVTVNVSVGSDRKENPSLHALGEYLHFGGFRIRVQNRDKKV